MTKEQMPSVLAMPQPFASGSGATKAVIGSVSSDAVNYVDGFPAVYSAPASGGGKYVSRGEMNALGNAATNDVHYFKCGGLNTFDAGFCAAIGGYPKGAILDYLVGYKIYKVLSLVDSNTVDFTESGIDSVNWIALNQDTSDIDKPKAFSVGLNTDSPAKLGVFKAQKDSNTWEIENKLVKTIKSTTTISHELENNSYWIYDTGFAVLVNDLGTSYTDWPEDPVLTLSVNNGVIKCGSVVPNGWFTLVRSWDRWCFAYSTSMTAGTYNSLQMAMPTETGFSITKGHYYAFAIYGAFADQTITATSDGSSVRSTLLTASRSDYSISGSFTLYY